MCFVYKDRKIILDRTGFFKPITVMYFDIVKQ